MRKQVVMAVAVLLALVATSQAEQWSIDAAHSSIGFSVRHMVITKTHGKFNDFTGQIEFDGKNLEKGSAQFTAQIASVDTDNEDRDKHLRSADFFDADTFPTMTFKSSKVIKGTDNKFQLVGDLTIKDVTRQVTFDCEFHGVVNDPMGNTRAGFSATAEINRQDFHVKWSKALDTGGLVVGNDVTISIEIEAMKPKG